MNYYNTQIAEIEVSTQLDVDDPHELEIRHFPNFVKRPPVITNEVDL